jgi:hypothetical protein
MSWFCLVLCRPAPSQAWLLAAISRPCSVRCCRQRQLSRRQTRGGMRQRRSSFSRRSSCRSWATAIPPAEAVYVGQFRTNPTEPLPTSHQWGAGACIEMGNAISRQRSLGFRTVLGFSVQFVAITAFLCAGLHAKVCNAL